MDSRRSEPTTTATFLIELPGVFIVHWLKEPVTASITVSLIDQETIRNDQFRFCNHETNP
jgi:hypothetical protein